MTKPSVLCHKKRVFQVTILVSVKIRIYGVLLLIHFELKYIYCSKQLADFFSTPVLLKGSGGKDWHYPVPFLLVDISFDAEPPWVRNFVR